jgi:hypothetical protein
MASDESRKRLQAAIADVESWGAAVNRTQLQSVLRVVAESSLAMAVELENTAGEIQSFNASMTEFNRSAGNLSEQLVNLNSRLTWATWAIAAGTLLLVAATAWAALSTH